ncbi:MAG: TonB-dependent receptor plug domain-containing protein [Muribaculaceae bacterium]
MTDSVFAINEVVVTASRNLTPQQTISQEQIENLASNSVADALKYMSGVQIKDYGGLGGQKTVNVRSLGSQHVGVYLDGVRITNAQNGTVDLGKYSLSTLESVSLYNANKTEQLMMASEYSSASTVYLRTKRPQSTSLVSSYSIGSFNTHKVNTTFSYKNYGFIDAHFTHSDGNYPFHYKTEYEDTTGTRRNGDIDLLSIESCLFYKNFEWHTYYYSSQRGLPGGVVRRLSDKYTDVGREWDHNFFSQLSYRKAFKSFAIRAIAKYANDKLHYRSDYPENMSVHSNNQYHQQDIYGALALSYNFKSLGLSASSDLRWSDLTTDVKNYHYVWRLDNKTSLSAMFKFKGLTLNASGLYTKVTDHTYYGAKPLERFTYNALASYQLCPNLSFRAFYKSVFRAPTLNDLYYTLVGNRNLKPEYTKQFDVGLCYNTNWLNLQIDGYYNRVTDRIVCLPLKGSFQWTMLNYGYTRCMGIDLSANLHYRIHSLFLSGAFQDDRNLTNPDGNDYRDFIAYSPRWTCSAIYSCTWKNLSGSVSYMFVDKRYWTSENDIEDPLDSYMCVDSKVAYRFWKLTAELECQNIFNKPYEMIQRWPMPGRRYMVTFKFHL